MSFSKIEWTEATWNPLTGCSKVSPGCKNCYAEKMAKRLQAMNSANYTNGFKLTCHPHSLDIPFSWKKSRMVFVNSMSDLFHEDVPDQFIKKVFNVMNIASQNQYQVLTKRSENLLRADRFLRWNHNIWMGVSVENAEYVYRIDHLKQTNAMVKFISFEPLIDDVGEINLNGIDWVIVGGESGSGARPIEKDWVMNIQQQCIKKNIAFFFKQWGGVNKKKTGRLLDGKIWSQMPKIEHPVSTSLSPA
jgi:protein gp37